MSTDPQTYWKRITLPPALAAAGWQLVKRDTSAPFALVNKKLDQDTGGFPDPQEAIAAAEALLVEQAEAAAIAAEGQTVSGPRSKTLPLVLIDEGWRLRKSSSGLAPRPTFAHRGELRTGYHQDPADAVAEAITLEAERQAEIERRENRMVHELDQFVATGQAAAAAVDQLRAPGADQDLEAERQEQEQDWAKLKHLAAGEGEEGNGHQDTPAELQLAIELIRTDGGTQQRSLFDHHAVTEYCEAMAQGDQFPAIDVFFDGADYWLADGFYRLEARRQLGRLTIPVQVRQGSQREAILFSLGANARHGLPRTVEDKRRAVLVMLRDPEWAVWSDAVIAERVHVSVPLVRKLRHQEAAAQAASESTGQAQPAAPGASRRKGRDGRVQDTTRIGKRKSGADPQLALEAAGAGGEIEETPPPAATNAASSAGDPLCSQCGISIPASKYRNAAGQCGECAGIHEKKPRGKKTEPAEPAPLTFAELGRGRDLFVGLQLRRKEPGRVFVALDTGKNYTGRFAAGAPFNAGEVVLPAALLTLIANELALERVKRQAAAAHKKTASKKPPARKPAVKAATVSRGTKKQTTGRAKANGNRTTKTGRGGSTKQRPAKRRPAAIRPGGRRASKRR